MRAEALDLVLGRLGVHRNQSGSHRALEIRVDIVHFSKAARRKSRAEMISLHKVDFVTESEPARFTLLAPVSAVKLQEHPGSTLRSPTETLIHIPTGASIELEGAVSKSGLVNVRWNGEFFSVFYDDVARART